MRHREKKVLQAILCMGHRGKEKTKARRPDRVVEMTLRSILASPKKRRKKKDHFERKKKDHFELNVLDKPILNTKCLWPLFSISL